MTKSESRQKCVNGIGTFQSEDTACSRTSVKSTPLGLILGGSNKMGRG